ncbi:MAG: hypothetical protein QOJ37_2740, partial [Pseudonocardiales bacterium]|nr:hypothetical protein [Pseudonocardiales bacterium]
MALAIELTSRQAPGGSGAITPALGQLRVSEVTPGVVSRVLAATAKSGGPGAAKSTRACLSGMFGLAIQDTAISANPVRDSV